MRNLHLMTNFVKIGSDFKTFVDVCMHVAVEGDVGQARAMSDDGENNYVPPLFSFSSSLLSSFTFLAYVLSHSHLKLIQNKIFIEPRTKT